jgi:mRNA-degrading endonuclease RelE of RelBE toxin-antitoxin system
MLTWKVFFTGTFEEKLEKSEESLKNWLEKILDQLEQNPFVGKPIKVNWFREKKFGKHRIYYLIYENCKSVYLVNMSEKKDQQAIINSIELLLEVYKKEIEEMSKENF